jgi:protein SCO1/2
MLMEMKQPLVEGARIPLTLVFRHAGRVAVQAVVQGPGAMTAPPDAPVAPTAGRARVGVGVPGAAAAVSPAATGAAYRLTVWPPHAATPGFTLMDTTGRSRTLADYRGRVVVLFFGFVHCPDVCPAELFKLGLVMQQLGPAAARVQVLFVTLDPARDTREVLKGYVTAFDPRFVGLTGSTAQIERAAGSFFVEYARVPAGADYTIDHSTSTFIVDGAGRLRLVGAAAAGVGDYSHDLALLIAEQGPRG